MTATRAIPPGLLTILTAAVGTAPADGRGSCPGASIVKLVLVLLWLHEGQELTTAMLGEFTGANDRTAWMAVRVLVRLGLVTRTSAGHRENSGGWRGFRYRLEHERIAGLPRVRTREVVAREQSLFYRRRRQRRKTEAFA